LGIVIGPAALVATIRGIAQDRKSGDEGGRASAVVALVLGVLVTLAGVFVALSLGGALHNGRH
jgi:hypothetical protein